MERVKHSYGLVNQYQILELLKIDGLRLFHHDLPFFNEQWNRLRNDASFPPDASGRSTPCGRLGTPT